MPKVKFVPQNIELEIKPNQTVLDLAHQNDIHIQSVCKGVPSCAECRIQIKEGEWNVIPPLKKELQLIGTAWFVDRSRLSCQLKCFGDVTIDLSQQIEKEQNAKRPRGKLQKDPKDSKAVTGSVLFEEPKVKKPATPVAPVMNAEDQALRRADRALQQEEINKQLAEIKRKRQQLNDSAPKDEE